MSTYTFAQRGYDSYLDFVVEANSVEAAETALLYAIDTLESLGFRGIDASDFDLVTAA